MSPHDGGTSTPPPPAPVKTQSNEDAMKQVVDPAKQIVKVAALQDVSGGFGFEACNDQGEPPYRGRLEMGFPAILPAISHKARSTPLSASIPYPPVRLHRAFASRAQIHLTI